MKHRSKSRSKPRPRKGKYKGSASSSRHTVSPGTVKGNKLWWRGTNTII